MTGLLQDFRFALRQLRRSPAFTAVVVITLAVGIGANTTVFSAIEAVMLRALPYSNPKRLALLTDSQDSENGGFLLRDMHSLRSQSHSFSDIAFYYRDSGFSNVTANQRNRARVGSRRLCFIQLVLCDGSSPRARSRIYV